MKKLDRDELYQALDSKLDKTIFFDYKANNYNQLVYNEMIEKELNNKMQIMQENMEQCVKGEEFRQEMQKYCDKG